MKTRFKKFQEKHKDNAFDKLNEFFDIEKKLFYESKILELTQQGISEQEATNKTRQGWVSTIGRGLEKVIELLIEDFCKLHNLSITNDKVLKRKKLTQELDELKRNLLVHFGSHSVLPDGDIIIYKKVNNSQKVLAILSVKNSFRERYTETPYWKLKLLQSEITKHIKVFMITPDKDDEISFNKNPRKSRIVMEYELDGIYIAKSDFDKSDTIKSIATLMSDLRKLT